MLEDLDVFNPNVNHMMQTELILGDSHWAGKITLIEVMPFEGDSHKYYLGIKAERRLETVSHQYPPPQSLVLAQRLIPLSNPPITALNEGEVEEMPLASSVSHYDSRAVPANGQWELVTTQGPKLLTETDVDFLRPLKISGK